MKNLLTIISSLLHLCARLMAGLRAIKLNSPELSGIIEELERDYDETVNALLESTIEKEEEA